MVGNAHKTLRPRWSRALSYTLLRVTPAGVVLWRAHAERLGLGAADARTVQARLRAAKAGVYAVHVEDDGVRIEPRANRTWSVAEPWTCMDSPLLGREGLHDKAAVSHLYEPMRCDPRRQLRAEVLCVGGGYREVYESARASVFAWDGQNIWAPPSSAPRVRSVSELALRMAFEVGERALAADGSAGALFLLNAVRGPGRLQDHEVPESVLEPIRNAMQSLTE